MNLFSAAAASIYKLMCCLILGQYEIYHRMMTILGLSLLSCPHCEAGFPTVPTLNDHIGQEHKHKKTSTGNMENGVASARCSSQSNVSTSFILLFCFTCIMIQQHENKFNS